MIFFALFKLFLSDNVNFASLESYLLEDRYICAEKSQKYTPLSCNIGSYNSLELFKKKVHYFRRPNKRKAVLKIEITSEALLKNRQNYQEEEVGKSILHTVYHIQW